MLLLYTGTIVPAKLHPEADPTQYPLLETLLGKLYD